ncbi:hypothetical protein JYT87_04085, partial [Nitrospira defluvii]|nr:hypothetical protein [Nitrospira defluvii]
EHDIPAYRSFLSATQTKDLIHRIMSNKEAEMKIGSCTISFLHPEGTKLDKMAGGNNQSVVMRLSCPSSGDENSSILFTGDIEEEAEAVLIERPDRLRSTILKVPHHGSRSSSSDRFISVVSPEIATISAGYRNRYRHPHPDVVSAYKAIGTAIYRTDEVGAITIEIRTDGGGGDGPKEQLWSYRNRRIERIEWSGFPLMQEWHNIKRGLRIF